MSKIYKKIVKLSEKIRYLVWKSEHDRIDDKLFQEYSGEKINLSPTKNKQKRG